MLKYRGKILINYFWKIELLQLRILSELLLRILGSQFWKWIKKIRIVYYLINCWGFLLYNSLKMWKNWKKFKWTWLRNRWVFFTILWPCSWMLNSLLKWLSSLFTLNMQFELVKNFISWWLWVLAILWFIVLIPWIIMRVVWANKIKENKKNW